MQDRGFNSLASDMIKLSVNETNCSSLLARTLAFIFDISILIFDFGPEKLPGRSINRPLGLNFPVNFARIASTNKQQMYCELFIFHSVDC